MDDVRVACRLHNLDFTEDSFFIVFVLNGIFVYDFDGDLFLSRCVNGLLNFSKSSFSDGFSESVVANHIRQGLLAFLSLRYSNLVSQLMILLHKKR